MREGLINTWIQMKSPSVTSANTHCLLCARYGPKPSRWICSFNPHVGSIYYCNVQFKDEKTKAQRGQVTCPRSHSWKAAEQRFESGPFNHFTRLPEEHKAYLSLTKGSSQVLFILVIPAALGVGITISIPNSHR